MAGTKVELYSSVTSTTLAMNDGTVTNGCEWQVTNLDGWLGPTPSIKKRQRMASDGVVITSAVKGPRSITVTGTCFADATSNLWDGMRDFEAAIDCTTGDGKVRVVEGAGSTRHAVVRLASPPSMQFTGPRSVSWSVSFLSPLPDLSTGP